jgi:Glyoxalase/Bleomycin resistance protein/Dioxygenase superfamily
MPQVVAIDHIAITVSDLEATCAFYDRLFGARMHLERTAEGKVQVRQIALGGGALLSVHQAAMTLPWSAGSRQSAPGTSACGGKAAWTVRPSCCAGTASRSSQGQRLVAPPTGSRAIHSTSVTSTEIFSNLWRPTRKTRATGSHPGGGLTLQSGCPAGSAFQNMILSK